MRRSLRLTLASLLFTHGCATTAQQLLPLKEVAATVELHQEHLQNCYERAFAGSRPDLVVRVAFDVQAFGKVRNARVLESTLANRVLERCVLSIISAAVFPGPEPGHHFEVTYPLHYEPQVRTPAR